MILWKIFENETENLLFMLSRALFYSYIYQCYTQACVQNLEKEVLVLYGVIIFFKLTRLLAWTWPWTIQTIPTDYWMRSSI